MNQDNNNENQELIDLEKAKHETRYSDSIKKRRFMQQVNVCVLKSYICLIKDCLTFMNLNV